MLRLDSKTIHSVCSGQIITSPYSIVKELTENCLDAGASIVDIRVEENGLNRIEVRDNGSGIKKEDVCVVALPHFTSKLQNFSDLSSISTYGYRGEALSAVCSVANIHLITRHSSDGTATSYTLNNDGIVTETGSCHNNKGTTITVTNLFKNLPVRKTFYQGRKGKEQFEMINQLIRGIAIANPSVRFMLRHNKKLVWQHSSGKDIKHSLVSVYGNVSDMVSFLYCDIKNSGTEITGMLNTIGKDSRKPPYFIINKRIVKFKALSKVLKRLYEGLYPHGAICITLNPSRVDVNVEVDKSAVICRDEAQLVSLIEKIIRDQVLTSIPQPVHLDESQDFYEHNLASQNTFNIDNSIVSDPSISVSNHKPPDSYSSILSENANTDKDTTNIMEFINCNFDRSVDPQIAQIAQVESNNIPMINSTNSQRKHEGLTDSINQDYPLIYSDDECSPMLKAKDKANLSLWEELENDLNSDQELFSPSKDISTKSAQNQIEYITHQTNDSGNCKDKEYELKNIINEDENKPPFDQKKEKKQASLVSWSQASPGLKLEFISQGETHPTDVSIGDSVKKKRNKTISPNLDSKRRKMSIQARLGANNKLVKNKTFTFSLQYIRSCLLFNETNKKKCLDTKAFKIDDKWLVVSGCKLFSFNPHRAQEVNVYRKMMSSQSLKYGPVLESGDWDIRPSDTSHAIMTFLSSCPIYFDEMCETEFITEKCLAINGIRIRKVNDTLFRVTNVCEDEPQFEKNDVLETLHLILNQRKSPHLENDLSFCEYSFVRCTKISDSMKKRAVSLSQSFAVFQPNSTDVIDLFSNTNLTDECVHGKCLKEILWEFDSQL